MRFVEFLCEDEVLYLDTVLKRIKHEIFRARDRVLTLGAIYDWQKQIMPDKDSFECIGELCYRKDHKYATRLKMLLERIQHLKALSDKTEAEYFRQIEQRRTKQRRTRTRG